MGKRYDLECLLADIEALLKSTLNSKLAEIDAEKADAITLLPIEPEAYFLQTMNSHTANYNPFLLYGVEDMGSQAQEGSAAQEVTISVVIVVVDAGESLNNSIRMFRYSRALKEIFEENYTLVDSGLHLKLHNLMPVQFNLQNSSDSYRAVGVNVITSLS